MQPTRLLRRFIPSSKQGLCVAILKILGVVAGVVLGKLTYASIMEQPSSRSNLLVVVSTLQQPQYLPAVIPLLLIPFVPLLRGHIRWIFVSCLIAGIYLSSLQWQAPKIFHASHRIKIQPSDKISHLLKSEEDAYLRQSVAPFLELRAYLPGAALILPEDAPVDLDSFRLFSIALVDKIERVPLQSEITPEELNTFASRPGARYFQYTGSSDKDRRYIFMAPTPSQVYRVYISNKNLVFAEEGYVVKRSD